MKTVSFSSSEHQSTSTRTFVARSLRAWRFRVWTAHLASILLGLVTGLLGLVIGPVMQSLFTPTQKFLPWSDVLGSVIANLLRDVLPAEGLDANLLVSRLPMVLMVIATVKALMTFYQWFTWEWIGEQLAKLWRDQVAAAFVSLRNDARDDGLIKAEEEQLGGVVAQDVRVLREFVVHYYGGLPREGLQVLCTALTLLALSPKLFGIFVLCIAPVGALLSRFGRRIRKRASRALNDNSMVSEWIQQRLLGLETIKHYGAESHETSAMMVSSQSLFERFRSAAKLKSRTSPLIEVFGVIAMSIALWFAFHDIALGLVSGAVMMSFFSSLALFAQSAAKLGRYINSNQDGKAAGERILRLLNALHAQREEIDQKVILPVVAAQETRLHVEGLTLGYGQGTHQKKVIENLSVSFDAGKIYCLVGPSGAGKSSLFNAILGLRAPLSGRIYGTVSSKWRDANLKVVSLPQTISLVPTTLERNVSYPELLADPVRVKDALMKSQFRLSENRLPDGLQTVVGPGNLQLSGGEGQRLQLARVYYHKSPFVLVDEGTSALDPVTEAEVLKSLRNIADQGACVIMIAHRRAAAEACDELILLDDGKIVASGKPSDVLKLNSSQSIFGSH